MNIRDITNRASWIPRMRGVSVTKTRYICNKWTHHAILLHTCVHIYLTVYVYYACRHVSNALTLYVCLQEICKESYLGG